MQNTAVCLLPKFLKQARSAGYKVIALSSSAPEATEQAKNSYKLI
jgi:hypothetical protein